jgi:hypothetical protein
MTTWVARLWFVVVAALSVVSAWAVWDGFLAFIWKEDHGTLAADLASYQVPRGDLVVLTLLLGGIGLRTLVFVGSALALGWFGRSRPLALVLGAGLLAYGVGIGFQYGEPPQDWRHLLELSRLVVIGTLAIATLSLPDGRWAPVWTAYAAVWIGTAWLLLYPVFLPWDGLRSSSTNLPVQLGFLVGGVVAMGVRYLGLRPAQRLQMKWVMTGIAMGAGGIAVSLVLPEGALADIFDLAIYPVLLCFAPVSTALALLEFRLWDLGRIQRWIGDATVLIGFVALLAVLLGEADELFWIGDRGAERLVFTVICVLVAALVVWLARKALANVADRFLFPDHLRRLEAVEQGLLAIEDVMDTRETLWAIHGVFQHGWPASVVEVFRRREGELVRLLSPTEAPASGPSATLPVPAIPPSVDRWALVSEDAGEAPVLWIRLRSHDQDVGAVRVTPPADAGFSSEDVALLDQMINPASLAVWRLGQQRQFLGSS